MRLTCQALRQICLGRHSMSKDATINLKQNYKMMNERYHSNRNGNCGILFTRLSAEPSVSTARKWWLNSERWAEYSSCLSDPEWRLENRKGCNTSSADSVAVGDYSDPCHMNQAGPGTVGREGRLPTESRLWLNNPDCKRLAVGRRPAGPRNVFTTELLRSSRKTVCSFCSFMKKKHLLYSRIHIFIQIYGYQEVYDLKGNNRGNPTENLTNVGKGGGGGW